MKYTFTQFSEQFPDEAACLDQVFKWQYGSLKECPHCKRETTFRRVPTRKCYQCVHCYHQIYPCANTVFHRSKVPLKTWFFAMFLFTNDKHGHSAAGIARKTGLGYVAAHRLLHKIRWLMKSGLGNDRPLTGWVELDESLVGGKEKNKHVHKRTPHSQGMSLAGKEPVFAMVERNGEARAFHTANLTKWDIIPIVVGHIPDDTRVSTDESRIYGWLKRQYKHGRVNHSKKQYRIGDHCTNTVENFFRRVKSTLHTYNRVSAQHLQNYLNEVCYRYNRRGLKSTMFLDLIALIPFYNPTRKSELDICPAQVVTF